MRVVAAHRVGGMGTTRKKDGAAGDAVANASAGPPPRLLKSPPKVETMPAHIFSQEEREKIHRLRRFFDSLEIVDEKPAAVTSAEAPGRADVVASPNVTTTKGEDGCCPDAIEGSAASEATTTTTGALSRTSSHPATPASGTCAVETASPASDAGAAGGSNVLPTSAGAAAPDKISRVECAASPLTFGFSWNFLRGGEAPEENTARAVSRGDSAADMSVGGVESSKRSEQQQQEAQQEKKQEEGVKLYWDDVLWLEDDLILARYLRSYDWDVEEAQKQLLRTLFWRRKEKPQHISPNQVATFARSGSVYRKGFDIYGRAVIYFKPGRDASTSSQLFQRYVVYTIERALESLDREAGVDQLVFVVDFSQWGISLLPRTEVSREIVSILNDHYTDVLAAAFIVNAPSYFSPIWRLVSLMVHPETAKKIVFVHTTKETSAQTPLETGSHSSGRDSSGNGSPGGDHAGSRCTQNEDIPHSVLRQLIPSPFLEQCVGGASPVDYDHDIYWQAENEQFLRQSIHHRQQRQTLQQAVRTRRRLQQEQQCLGTTAAEPLRGIPDTTAAVM